MPASTSRDAERPERPDASHAGPFTPQPHQLETPTAARPADVPSESDDLQITLELDLIDALKGMYFFG